MRVGVWFGDQERGLALVKRIQELPETKLLQVDSKHEFRQTPDSLILGKAERQQFEEIGRAGLIVLKRTGRFYEELLSGEPPFPLDGRKYFQKALEVSQTKCQNRLQKVNPSNPPPFFRADCLLNLKADGSLQIFANEIEGGRAIGLGFGVFAQTVRQDIFKASRPGLVEAMVESLGFFAKGEKIAHILGEDELFYLPEQELFCQRMRQAGIPIFLVREKELQLRGEGVVLPDGTVSRKIFCFSSFNSTKADKAAERGFLIHLYEEGELEFFIPPNGFFGNKAVYGLIHHPFFREFYEQDLEEAGIGAETIDNHFPYSSLVTGSSFERERLLLEMGIMPQPPIMIKAVGLSASRGLAFPSDPVELQRLASVARKSPFRYLVQEFKPQAEFKVNVLNGSFLHEESQFFRLAAFYVALGGQAKLVEVVGTGLGPPLATSERPTVHGNPECIMFPVIFADHD